MAKYASVSVSGYNATPPADDGTVSEANKVKWSTGKTKLTDPLKTALESINTNLVSAFDNGPTALSTSTTLAASHYGDFIQVSGSAVTLTLTDAATLGAGWFCDINSTDTTYTVTIGRATGADTIDGTAANVTIPPLESMRIYVNAAANGFITQRHRNLALNRDVAVAEVVSTTDETTVYSFAVPANTLGTNRMLRLSLIGDYYNNSGSSDLTVKVKLGSTIVGSYTEAGIGTNAARTGFLIESEISALNATNAQACKTRFSRGSTGGGVAGVSNTPAYNNYAIHVGVAEDSTAALTLAVTVTHSVSNAAISFKCYTAHLELV